MWQNLTETTEQLIGGVGSAITAIATQLGLIIQHLYLVLVRQQVLIGVQQMLTGFLWIGFAMLNWHFFKYVSKKRSWEKLDKIIVMSVLCTVLFVSSMKGALLIVDALPRILNPEYYAIQESVKLLKEVQNK